MKEKSSHNKKRDYKKMLNENILLVILTLILVMMAAYIYIYYYSPNKSPLKVFAPTINIEKIK